MPVFNPFLHGNPVPSEKLFGRNDELRQIVGRIRTGQSTAITGSPRSGKTSILRYLREQKELYEEDGEKLVFSELDAATWNAEFTPIKFWEIALRPISEFTDTVLSQAYEDCKKNQFSDYSIEKLLMRVNETNKRLILMVDEFNLILEPKSSSKHWNAAFFGGLRTLASRSSGALVLIITINEPLNDFQQKVQDLLTNSKSPYFNTLYEVRLHSLSSKVIERLLLQGGENFKESCHTVVYDIAGGHPYLSQVAASMLWEKREESEFVIEFIENFHFQVKGVLDEIWQSWSGALQEAFISVTLIQMKELKDVFEQRLQIDIDKLIRRMPMFALELNILKQYGFVTEDKSIQGGWRVVPRVFLPFALLNFKKEYRDKLSSLLNTNLFNSLFMSEYNKKFGLLPSNYHH